MMRERIQERQAEYLEPLKIELKALDHTTTVSPVSKIAEWVATAAFAAILKVACDHWYYDEDSFSLSDEITMGISGGVFLIAFAIKSGLLYLQFHQLDTALAAQIKYQTLIQSLDHPKLQSFLEKINALRSLLTTETEKSTAIANSDLDDKLIVMSQNIILNAPERFAADFSAVYDTIKCRCTNSETSILALSTAKNLVSKISEVAAALAKLKLEVECNIYNNHSEPQDDSERSHQNCLISTSIIQILKMETNLNWNKIYLEIASIDKKVDDSQIMELFFHDVLDKLYSLSPPPRQDFIFKLMNPVFDNLFNDDLFMIFDYEYKTLSPPSKSPDTFAILNSSLSYHTDEKNDAETKANTVEIIKKSINPKIIAVDAIATTALVFCLAFFLNSSLHTNRPDDNYSFTTKIICLLTFMLLAFFRLIHKLLSSRYLVHSTSEIFSGRMTHVTTYHALTDDDVEQPMEP